MYLTEKEQFRIAHFRKYESRLNVFRATVIIRTAISAVLIKLFNNIYLIGCREIVASLPIGLAKNYPKARWLFLTLTHKTCLVTDLKSELQAMSKAWGRLVLRKEFSEIIGWTRAVEVTRSKSDETHAHPHYHCLLMVKPNYFSRNYISQEEWVLAWKGAMRLDYLPVCDVRACRDKKGGKIAAIPAIKLM